MSCMVNFQKTYLSNQNSTDEDDYQLTQISVLNPIQDPYRGLPRKKAPLL